MSCEQGGGRGAGGDSEDRFSAEVVIIDDSSPSPERSGDEGREEEGREGASQEQRASPRLSLSQSSEWTATCMICYEKWTTSGAHRVVCLKCGHLFGQSCIAQWLRQSFKCPQCNSRCEAAHLGSFPADVPGRQN